jgi:CHAD domain-containing protein
VNSFGDNGSMGRQSDLGLHQYLAGCFADRCRKYRKSLDRCRKTFSQDSVHQLRVETRRLLAFLSLLEPLLHAQCLREVKRHLRKLFKNSARLRDTQVQLLRQAGTGGDFPEVAPFHQSLRRREKRLTRRLKRIIRDRARPELGRSMTALKKVMRRLLTEGVIEEQHRAVLLGGIDQAFSRVVALHRQIHANHPVTIHRLRIAFKKFRYRVESMQPLLPGISSRRLRDMHAFQTRMGEIQDAEVLLRALDKYERKSGNSPARFRAAVVTHETKLIVGFMKVADQVFAFKPVGCSAPNPPAGKNEIAK